MGKVCIRCGYERKDVEHAPPTECPKCGVIYARVEQGARDAAMSPDFLKSPRGRARRARNGKRKLFQVEIPLDETVAHSSFLLGTFTRSTGTADASTVLEQIEAEGWVLIDASYVFRPTGSASREKIIGTTEVEAISGQILGIYLFRASEGPPPHPDAIFGDEGGRTTFTAPA